MTMPDNIARSDQTMREYQFTDHDFQTIATLAHQRYGLHLQPSKKTACLFTADKKIARVGSSQF